ncbi:MAG: hypothetical protein LBT86_00705 [Deltaproteobacteria bacterium]|jgi:hypothetical protein|nr:hypothetical protein [Deltaproteobacteria bacterium]
MGIHEDYELAANCLAGSLGGARERLGPAMGRLLRVWPPGAYVEPGGKSPDCRSPARAAAITQTLNEYTDVWEGLWSRATKFRLADDLLTSLKGKVLADLVLESAIWSDYPSLAQNLIGLTMEKSLENPAVCF